LILRKGKLKHEKEAGVGAGECAAEGEGSKIRKCYYI
jgi:hypothetical protein